MEPTKQAPAEAKPDAVEQAVPQAQGDPVLDAYIHSNPQYVDQSKNPVAPAVDTSAATLDFAVVGNGVPITLNGPKTITGCPDNVWISIGMTPEASGLTDYYVTANGKTYHQVGYATFLSPNVPGFDLHGPKVDVAVSAAGLFMEIHQA